jgi:hypothetical protein
MSINYCYFSERDKKWKTCDDQKEYKARKDSGEQVKTLRDKTCDTLNSESNSDFENWKKNHPESDGWVLYSDSDTCNKYWDTNKYQRDYKYNKGDKKTYCAIKNIGGTSVTPSPGTSGYKECTDFYQLNCKDTGSSVGRPNTNGPIYKVQGCIGVKQDSFFGPKTQSALQAKIGKNYFTEDQVEAICKGEVPGGTKPKTSVPITNEDKIRYFKDLAKKNRIYPKGVIHKRPDGDIVYVIKYVNNEQSPLDPSLSLAQQINMDDIEKGNYDIVYHFVPKTNEDEGIWTRLIVATRYGEKKLIPQTPEEDMVWTPDPEMDIDVFTESKIKSILKKVLLEQQYEGLNVKIPNKKPNVSGNQGQPGSQTTTGGGTSQTQQGAQASVNTKPDPTKVKETIEPIKSKTLQLLRDIQNDPKFKIGAKEEDKKQLEVAIKTLEDFKSENACEESSIKMIDDNIKFIDETIKKNESTFGAASLIAKMKEIKVNLQKVKSECNKLKASVQTTSGSGTKPTGDQTQQGGQNNQGQQSEDLYKLFGFVKPDGQSYNPTVKIEKLGNQALGESGTGTLQSAIDSSGARSYNFSKYNELVGSIGLGDEYKLKIPTNSPQNPGEVITKDNESILFPLEDLGSKQEFTQESFGKYLGTNSTAAIFISKRKTSTTMTSRRRCPFDKTGAREFLINYLSNGLTTLDSPRLEEKQTLCACRIDGTFDKLDPINKKDWEGIAKSEKPVNLFNQNLRWNDVVKLISGDKVAGETLNKNYQITNFMTDACGTTMRESISSSVKSHISEAINKKKKLTESIVNKVTKKLI